MLIHVLTIADLRDGLESGDLWPGGEAVMPRHRAASYVANPRALDRDPALLVGMTEEGDPAGFLNVLSDDLDAGGVRYHMGWLSAWWAAPEYRDTGVGGMLLFKALAAWKNRIGISGFTPDARQVYDATRKFTDVAHFNGAVFEEPSALPDAPCDISDTVPGSMFWDRAGQAFARRKAEFEWMMDNPWILESDQAAGGYPFSTFDARFRPIMVHEEHGLFFCLLRGERLKVKYAMYEDAAMAADILLAACGRLGVNSLEIHDEPLVAAIETLEAFATSRPVELTFLVAKALLRGVENIGSVQPGDGDFAFT